MLETVKDLIPNKTIPALEPVQMLALLQDVLTLLLRARTARTAHRHARVHRIFGPFLTSTLLAHCSVATAQEVN